MNDIKEHGILQFVINIETNQHRAGLTSRVFVVAVVVFPVVFERQLVAQCRGQSQQAGSTGPGGQGGLEARRVRRERDGDGVVREVLSLELLLLNHTEIMISVMLHFKLKHFAWSETK